MQLFVIILLVSIEKPIAIPSKNTWWIIRYPSSSTNISRSHCTVSNPQKLTTECQRVIGQARTVLTREGDKNTTYEAERPVGNGAESCTCVVGKINEFGDRNIKCSYNYSNPDEKLDGKEGMSAAHYGGNHDTTEVKSRKESFKGEKDRKIRFILRGDGDVDNKGTCRVGHLMGPFQDAEACRDLSNAVGEMARRIIADFQSRSDLISNRNK